MQEAGIMSGTFTNTRKLTFLALMLAITIILDLTPLGAVPLGTISATVTHIPTILTGVILGPLAGWIMGTLMGLTSLIHALTRPATIIDPLFIHPLVSVLPRMFIGITAYYTGQALKKAVKVPAASFAAGVVGSITNTVLVFLMLYLVYAKVLELVGAQSYMAVILPVLTTNAIAEAVISGLITMAVVLAYNKYSKSEI
jgi:uncharacterized membrane protein